MKLNELIVRLRIKEDNRNFEKKTGKSPMGRRPMLWNKGLKIRSKSILVVVHLKCQTRSLRKSATNVIRSNIEPMNVVESLRIMEVQTISLPMNMKLK